MHRRRVQGKGRSPEVPQAIFLALLMLSQSAAGQDGQNHDNAILFYLYQQYWVANPISGQNFPPPSVPVLQYFQGIPDIDIDCALWVETVSVNETTHSFTARYWWSMNYEDARVAELVRETNSSSECATLCSTHAGLVLNKYRDNACCTEVYMPNSYFQNIIGGYLQNQPNEWLVFPVPGTDRVQYWARGTSVFSVKFDYSAFPFDRQRLEFRVMNEFMPQLDGNSSIQLLSPSTIIPALSAFKNLGGTKSFGIKGWRVLGTSAQATAFKQQSPFADRSRGLEKWQPGIIFVIEIQRVTTLFWFILLILPILLLILFSFLSFILDEESLKARMSLLSAMFLAVLILQYSTQAYLPGNASIMPPYIVIMVTYICMLLMAAIFLIGNTISDLPHTNMRKIRLLHAKAAQLRFEEEQLHCMLQNKQEAHHILGVAPEQVVDAVKRQMHHTEAQLQHIKRRIDALTGPWYAHGEARPCSAIGILSTAKCSQSLSKWCAYVSMPEAEEYCHYLADATEFWLVLMLIILYSLTIFLVYYLSYSKQSVALHA